MVAVGGKSIDVVVEYDPAHSLQCLQRSDCRCVLRADGARSVAYPQSVRRDQFRPRRIPGDRRLSRLHTCSLCRILGRARHRADFDRLYWHYRRARADPPTVRARSVVQSAADLRACLHHRGRHALHLGRAEPAVSGPRLAGDAAEQRIFLSHRLPPVHGGGRRHRRHWAFPNPQSHPARHPHPRRARSISKPFRCSASMCAFFAT